MYPACAEKPAKPAAIWVSKTFAKRRAPGAAEDRDVLAAGVQDHLDRGVGEHLRQRSGIAEILLQRVEHDDLLADADLHEAEQRAIAALGHELRVDPEPPLLAGACGET